MSDIQVQCQYCQRDFSVSKDLGGLLATCPYCSRQVNVPLAAGQMDLKSDLKIKKGTSVAGGRCCPKCGAVMGHDAVICIQCGYDQRSGLQFSGKPELTWRRPWIMAAAGIVILAGLVWSLLRSEEEPIVYAPPVKKTLPAAAVPTPSPDVVSTQTAVLTASLTLTDAVVVAHTNLEEKGAPLFALSEEEERRMEAELREKLDAQLKTMYPIFTNGEHVALRRSNGMIHRGTYLGINSNNVVLLVGREPMRVPLAVLDNATRLRTDAMAREKFIDYHVTKKMADKPLFK